jgi:hypothetical protein
MRGRTEGRGEKREKLERDTKMKRKIRGSSKILREKERKENEKEGAKKEVEEGDEDCWNGEKKYST